MVNENAKSLPNDDGDAPYRTKLCHQQKLDSKTFNETNKSNRAQ